MATGLLRTEICFASRGRCDLCLFALNEGDLFVAVIDDRITREFSYLRSNEFVDDVHDDVQIKFWSGSPWWWEEVACLHSNCYQFRPRRTSTKEFLDTTYYNFEPSGEEERRRAAYIQLALACNLQDNSATWPRQLPPELWLKISGLLVRECAIVNLEEQTHACKKAEVSAVDLTCPLYASYVKIDGRYYVQSLQNTVGTKPNKKATCLLKPAATKMDDQGVGRQELDLFVADDHIGVRQIVFVPPKRLDEWSRSHRKLPGVWWRHIAWGTMSSTLVTRSDDFKLRAVESLEDESPPFPSRIGWQVPLPCPPPVVPFSTLERPGEYEKGLRMGFFDCNSPDIVGYSIAREFRLADETLFVYAISTHRQGERVDATLFNDVHNVHWHSMPLCMYMPMNKGEYITDICRLTFETDDEIGAGITFSTNQGRTTVFAPYGHGSVNMDLRRVAALPQRPCRVFLNQLDRFVGPLSADFIACEQGVGGLPAVSQDLLPTLPVSISPDLPAHMHGTYFRTACTMEHPTEVLPCINKTEHYQPVMGMLLTYADGHRECVGQFRLDWVAQPFRVF